MAARREIREFDLLEYARCLLRKPERVPYVLPADILTAELAAKSLLLQTFSEGRVPEASAVRKVYEESWQEVTGYDPDLKQPPRSGLAIARRLRDILFRFEIHQPVTKYVLNLGRATVSGEYAVVSDRRRPKAGLCVLRWRHKQERFERQFNHATDIVNYARWLHLRNIESHVPEMGILNISLDSEEMWRESITAEKHIRSSLSYLVESAVNEQGFPSPGPYCRNCQTNACQHGVLVDIKTFAADK